MVTRKPVGDGAAQYNTAPSVGQPSTLFPVASQNQQESIGLEYDWDTCDDQVPNANKPAIPLMTESQTSRFQGHAGWSGVAPPESQFVQSSETGADFGVGNLSLDQQSTGRRSGELTTETNPFLKKRSSPIISADTESSAAIWGEGSSVPHANVAPPPETPPQLPLIQLDSEDPWSELGDPASASEHARPVQGLEVAGVDGWNKGKGPGNTPPRLEMPSPHPFTTPEVETPSTKAKRERNEVYQIKHIRWFDASSRQNPRNSPILIQNANGPCPLLALVNALVLTTPSELVTPLIETLRTREQVSLGLLLDAVFDELMSDRRSGNSPDLPDVGDLYAFLVTLHTGMNVNPRFVPAESMLQSNDEELPGSFEDTREMKLYSTFAIPLIHGWLPHRHEMAYQAFQRTAQSYEDAQNVQFREDELEQKLKSGELTSESQSLLNDVTTIKQFFTYWPTQLTAHGLDVINKYMKPGQIAILFRNDHFSMLYREPRSSRLMTLVTDAGYATHDEIVWESLVDINGSSAEWYSGDFRSVSHDNPVQESCEDDEEWQPVEGKHARKRRAKMLSNLQANEVSQVAALKAKEAGDGAGLPEESNRTRSTSEQEDHDLALALQLQEEEEERQRNEVAARRAREDDLSQQYISQQSSNANLRGGIRIPPRRNGLPQANSTPRPATERRSSDETAPPSYEQAASGRPFHPPRNHPSSEHAPLRSTPSQSSAYSQNSSLGHAVAGQSSRGRMSARQSLSNQMPPVQTLPQRRLGRIETGMNSPHSDREDKCIVM